MTSFALPMATLMAAVVFFLSYLGTRLLVGILTRHAILDHPNHRSSHGSPTPHGGGIAVLAALLPAWLLIEQFMPGTPDGLLVVVGGTIFLAVVSWIDDVRSLGPAVRLLAQATMVAVVLSLAPFTGPVFGGWLPPMVDLLLAALLWIWFINLFNFMDGIDGIAGVQSAGIGMGVFVAAKVGKLDVSWLALGLSVAAASVGFLRWNWHPAKIFLGDVGSIPLGFLLGWLLLGLAAAGYPAPAIILPAYFLADATITLGRRLLRGEKIWEAHREHFYQLAVQSGLRHDQVSGIIMVANIFLIALTLVAMRGLPWPAVSGAAAAVALLLFLLAKGGPTD
ncbi:MAG: glycosyltransferase family 4 protein [Rhodospirillaceae bacterium]|nr:glycosyltransferase family 4 protein [Rhodospirillaceae bacterium]